MGILNQGIGISVVKFAPRPKRYMFASLYCAGAYSRAEARRSHHFAPTKG